MINFITVGEDSGEEEIRNGFTREAQRDKSVTWLRDRNFSVLHDIKQSKE